MTIPPKTELSELNGGGRGRWDREDSSDRYEGGIGEEDQRRSYDSYADHDERAERAWRHERGFWPGGHASSRSAARFDEHEGAKPNVEPPKLITDAPKRAAGRTQWDERDNAIMGCKHFRKARVGRRDREPSRGLPPAGARGRPAGVQLASDDDRRPFPLTPAHDHGACTPSVASKTLTHGLAQQDKSGPRPYVELVTVAMRLVRSP